MVEIPKLTISTENASEVKAKLKDAETRKKSATETLEEAWERIMQTKSYRTDKEKLDKVRKAMLSGELGREPVPVGEKQRKFSAAEAKRLYKRIQAREKERKLRELVENTPENYDLVLTEERLEDVINALGGEEEIAVDTETTGVDVYTDVIVGISFTLPKADWNVYIPVDHNVSAGGQLARGYVLRRLDEAMRRKTLGKVLHNAVFDIAMFRRHGYELSGVSWDTQTAMHLLNENEPSFRLKNLAPKWLQVEADTFGELFGKTKFSEIPLDVALVYAAKDTELTWKLYQFQRKQMERYPTILRYYTEVEVPLLHVIVALEANGYILDLDFAEEYRKKLHKRIDELVAELTEALAPYHEGGGAINLNSTQQMKPALSKAIGRKLPNMDAKKTLKPLKSKYPIIASLLEYKKLTKMAGTYIDSLPLKRNVTTKRWHSRFNVMGTVTGRFSSGKDKEGESVGTEFNVQNIPGDARPMFVAPEGKVIIGADFKAQEIRCVAYLSGEPVLINAFSEGRDPYAMMASNFYKRPYEEVYKLPNGDDTPERKEMKVVWLATLYGMSPVSLAEMLGVSKEEAVEFQTDLFESMPKLNAWLEGNKEFVKKHGYVWADHQYRKRRLPDAKLRRKRIPYGKYFDDKYKEERIHNAKIGTALRQATNARVQGSSSIQTKVTMLKAHEYCADKPRWALWGSVHDEILFEAPADFTREEGEEVRRIMVDSYPWGDVVPNGTDIEVMERWGEGVPLDEWFAKKEEETE